MERDRLLRAVAAGLKTKVFKPQTVRRAGLDGFIGITHAVGVHRAMKIYAGNAVTMRLQDALDFGRVGNVCRAFIMYDDVVTFGIIGIAKNAQRRVCRRIIGMDLVHDDIRARLEPLFEDVLLVSVVMTTATGYKQSSNRSRRCKQCHARTGGKADDQSRTNSKKGETGGNHEILIVR